jgi:hypothetical protein
LELARREAILQCDADRLVQFLMRQKSNVAALSVTSDKPPLGQILTPAQATTYFGGMVVNYSSSASDKEDGILPASAFT